MLLIFNMLAFLGALALIGFWPTLHAVVIMSLAYSAYLTLREWVVVLLVLAVLGAISQ